MGFKLEWMQIGYDSELPSEDEFCMRCDEQISIGSGDYCEHCLEIVLNQYKREYEINKER